MEAMVSKSKPRTWPLRNFPWLSEMVFAACAGVIGKTTNAAAATVATDPLNHFFPLDFVLCLELRNGKVIPFNCFLNFDRLGQFQFFIRGQRVPYPAG